MTATPESDDESPEADWTPEYAAYYEHARWLLEWHNKRNDAIITRSVALLGFVGVTLALMANGARSNPPLNDGTCERALALIAVGLFLIAGLFCLLTLTTKTSSIPSTKLLRMSWMKFPSDPVPGQIQQQLAEDLLHGQTMNKPGPVDIAQSEADGRAKTFKVAITSLYVGLLVLAILFFRLINP